MNEAPPDERAGIVQELLVMLGADGVEALARHKQAALDLVARLQIDEPPVPAEAYIALESCRRQREAIGRAGRIGLYVDHAKGRVPKWRVVADGRVWAAYDQDLVGTIA